MVPHRVEAVGSGSDGLMQSSKLQVRTAIGEMSSSERRGKRAERRDKTEYRHQEAARGPEMRPPDGGPTFFFTILPPDGTSGGLISGPRAEGREQRKERREKRENCRELDPLHFYAARGPEMRPPEGGQPFSTPYCPLMGPLAASSRDRGQREESREKREERRKKIAASSIHFIFTVPRGHFKDVMKIRRGHRNCRKLESLHFYGAP